MLSVNKDSFTSSFLIQMPLLSFSCLIKMARIPSTLLNRTGKNVLIRRAVRRLERFYSFILISQSRSITDPVYSILVYI